MRQITTQYSNKIDKQIKFKIKLQMKSLYFKYNQKIIKQYQFLQKKIIYGFVQVQIKKRVQISQKQVKYLKSVEKSLKLSNFKPIINKNNVVKSSIITFRISLVPQIVIKTNKWLPQYKKIYNNVVYVQVHLVISTILQQRLAYVKELLNGFISIVLNNGLKVEFRLKKRKLLYIQQKKYQM
ncbi:zinc finger protein, putative [Ichthyophthirius multifiliis]|uniref:Zinc finger protein, putative n=1 Tax=Ichthyophthirius multifiliis TaxID=5932 RepID=G0QKF0_ICHMU|nr:zinc finger protein, putative [Ichthyophthirius multifiliis]EGR34303.1 zinc finger protein, putative [Ichthyophthirius multifiliis]|eukprot:XP_004039607.1 zinc finger protein, putative [Ichthyophthirius multifiliis]